MNRYKSKSAFTLVEILIVVIIMGILASIAITQFSSISLESKENMLRENLRIIRTQIAIYRAQHSGLPPGKDSDGNISEALFVAQITGKTDMDGNPGNLYGPYMSKIPSNTLNQNTTVSVVNDLPDAASGDDGWIFNPDEIAFYADSTGSDSDGKLYYEY